MEMHRVLNMSINTIKADRAGDAFTIKICNMMQEHIRAAGNNSDYFTTLVETMNPEKLMTLQKYAGSKNKGQVITSLRNTLLSEVTTAIKERECMMKHIGETTLLLMDYMYSISYMDETGKCKQDCHCNNMPKQCLGRRGRSQEFALAAAPSHLWQLPRVCFGRCPTSFLGGCQSMPWACAFFGDASSKNPPKGALWEVPPSPLWKLS